LFKDSLQLDTALITLLSYCKSEQVIIFSRVFSLLPVLLLTVTILVLHDKTLYVMFNVSVELLILGDLLETAANSLFKNCLQLPILFDIVDVVRQIFYFYVYFLTYF